MLHDNAETGRDGTGARPFVFFFSATRAFLLVPLLDDRVVFGIVAKVYN
jgi:hypothetical protein